MKYILIKYDKTWYGFLIKNSFIIQLSIRKDVLKLVSFENNQCACFLDNNANINYTNKFILCKIGSEPIVLDWYAIKVWMIFKTNIVV